MKSWEEESPLFPLLKLSAGSGGVEEEEGEVLSFPSPSLGNYKGGEREVSAHSFIKESCQLL